MVLSIILNLPCWRFSQWVIKCRKSLFSLAEVKIKKTWHFEISLPYCTKLNIRHICSSLPRVEILFVVMNFLFWGWISRNSSPMRGWFLQDVNHMNSNRFSAGLPGRIRTDAAAAHRPQRRLPIARRHLLLRWPECKHGASADGPWAVATRRDRLPSRRHDQDCGQSLEWHVEGHEHAYRRARPLSLLQGRIRSDSCTYGAVQRSGPSLRLLVDTPFWCHFYLEEVGKAASRTLSKESSVIWLCKRAQHLLFFHGAVIAAVNSFLN